MRGVRFIIELLPRLLEAYGRFCAKIGSEGFSKPGFYVSTLFFAPAGLYWWRKPVAGWWRRVPARILAYVLMLLAVRVFVAGLWVFFFLTIFGRPIRFAWYRLGFDESREAPRVSRSFFFFLTKLDKAALIFIGVILLVFFLNRDQLMPKEDSDHNYHMAVARQIIDQGGIPARDDWEYAPAGRPHLYPPALHMAIALFAGRAEKIEEGFATLQVLVYPMGIFLTWWFARWLFGARMGLMAAMIFSMDMMAGATMLTVLPSAVVTALMPPAFMCFLTRRKKASIILLTLCLYTHMGVPVMIILGLFVFSARYKGYYGFFKSVLTWSLVWYLPWFLRLLPEIRWLGMPSTAVAEMGGRTIAAYAVGAIMGLLSLQAISVVLAALGLWGLLHFRHPAARFLRCMLLGFLPMLILYGGRFQMHTAPIWTIFAASVVVRFLPQGATSRRIVVLMLCTMIPLPALVVGMPGERAGIRPTVGGGFFALMYVLSPVREDTDFNDLADFITETTAPREIVHVDPAKNYLGDRIVTATGRRVDVGGWAAEVRNSRMLRLVERFRALDINCLFIYENAPVPDELACDRVVPIGRFNIGVRGKTAPLAEQSHPPEKPTEEPDAP